MWYLESPKPPIAGTCAQCGEPVYEAEDHYEFPDGDIVHDDCMIEFVRENYHRSGSVYTEV